MEQRVRGRCGGQIVREATVRSERAALVGFFADRGLSFARIGLEAGPVSQWLYAGLAGAGLPALPSGTAPAGRGSRG